MQHFEQLFTSFDPAKAEIAGAATTQRFLSDLRGCFADGNAYDAALSSGNPPIYHVASIEPGCDSGDLHLGIGLVLPGRIGSEYYMTKGHFHSWREAAEVYIGLRGDGVMLLENESNGQCQLLPLQPNRIVYVPGHTAHRTINIGAAPLTYLGIYPAKAGHDYGASAARNFRHVVIERDGRPLMLERSTLLL